MRLKHLLFFLIVFTAFNCSIKAQLCQGSLGDPVVNITFGSGAGGSQPFSLSNYTFVARDCPDDGSYTLTATTNSCFGSTWHSLAEDHTPGDNNGFMMLVNASYTHGDFYLDTVKNLCPNTTYEFAAWIVNVLQAFSCGGNGIKPNLTFRIEKPNGVLIKSYDTGDILATSSPQWKQYGFFFTTPADASDVVIRLQNNADGGCGNDLAVDDITFRPCGPDVSVGINGFEDKDSVDFCEGSTGGPHTLAGTVSSGYNDPVLQWQVSEDGGYSWKDINSANGDNYVSTVTGVGSYIYRLSVVEAANISSANCRINSNIVKLNINPLPQINAGSNSPVCGGEDLVLTAAGGGTYLWKGPNNFISTSQPLTISHPDQAYAGKYNVTVTTGKGCVNTDSTSVGIFPAAVANAGNDVTICEGSSTQLNGSGGISFKWSPFKNLSSADVAAPNASPADSLVYTLTVTDNNGCKATDSVAVNVLSKPFADAGPDKIIMGGQSAQLQGRAAGDSISYTWAPLSNITNAAMLQPSVFPEHDATYTLLVSSKAGCGTATDNVFVRVFEKVTVPNAFSPNGDGINDTWVMDAINAYPECEVQVFNRYGQPVFSSKGYGKSWNGTYNGNPLPVATYYYVILLDKALPKLTGWIMILK